MAAEGINMSGKGVLQVCFDRVGNCDDVSSGVAETALRVPVCALDVMGFRHSEEVLHAFVFEQLLNSSPRKDPDHGLRLSAPPPPHQVEPSCSV